MDPDPDGICHFGWRELGSVQECPCPRWDVGQNFGLHMLDPALALEYPVSLWVAAAPPCAADVMGEKRILLQRDWEAPTSTPL